MRNTLVFVKFEKVTVEIELSCFFFVKYSFTARHGTARIVITAVPKARFPTLASASFDFVNGFVRFISSNLVLKKSMILEGEDFELCFGWILINLEFIDSNLIDSNSLNRILTFLETNLYWPNLLLWKAMYWCEWVFFRYIFLHVRPTKYRAEHNIGQHWPWNG